MNEDQHHDNSQLNKQLNAYNPNNASQTSVNSTQPVQNHLVQNEYNTPKSNTPIILAAITFPLAIFGPILIGALTHISLVAFTLILILLPIAGLYKSYKDDNKNGKIINVIVIIILILLSIWFYWWNST